MKIKIYIECGGAVDFVGTFDESVAKNSPKSRIELQRFLSLMNCLRFNQFIQKLNDNDYVHCNHTISELFNIICKTW